MRSRGVSWCSLLCLWAGPVGAATVVVGAGGDFQAALNLANPGDTILLQAGATFTTAGGFTLPNKGSTTLPITIQSTAMSLLPSAGYRVKPTDSANMPKLVSTVNASPVLQTAASAQHYILRGIEMALAPGRWSYTMVIFGTGLETTLPELPSELVVDRCYVHGDPTALPGTKRGIQLNTGNVTVENSYISEIHVNGQDSQAIASFNGSGPFMIRNNYLEASTENVIFGGADPKIPNLVPSDIQILRNHFFKPLSWLRTEPSYAGIPWSVKNLFELKNAQRVLVDGNIFENNWADGQVGFAIVLTPRSQDQTAPWSVVKDVTFTHNIVRHSASAVNMLSEDDLSPSQVLENVVVKDNLFEDINPARFGGDGRLFQFVSQIHPARSITIDHNTALHSGNGNSLITLGDTNIFADRLVFTNNIGTYGTYGVHTPLGEGTVGLNGFLSSYLFSTNAIANGGTSSRYPVPNFFPPTIGDIGFVNVAASDFHLASSSLYKNAATDGNDIGADMDAVLAATCGTLAGVPTATCSSTPVDSTPPVITAAMATADSPFSAIFTWTTDEPADSQVEYGATTAYGQTSPLDMTRTTSHRVAINGLSSRKSYHARIRSRDASVNLAQSGDLVFKTPSRGTIRLLVPNQMSVNGTAEISYSGETAANFLWTFSPYGSAAVAGSTSEHLRRGAGISVAQQTTQFSLAPLNLAPGTYGLSVTATYSDGDQSDPAQANVTLVSGASASIRVRPNPWRADRHNGVLLMLDGLQAGSPVKVFSVSGRFVKSLVADQAGTVRWDLINDAGRPVASGLYLYIVTDTSGQLSRGTLSVIR